MNIKIGKVFLYRNKSVDRLEIVKIQSIMNENLVRVSHLNEEGGWMVYLDKDDIEDMDDEFLTNIFKANALSAKIMILRLTHQLNMLINTNAIQKMKAVIENCRYEPNFYDCDISQYNEYLDD